MDTMFVKIDNLAATANITYLSLAPSQKVNTTCILFQTLLITKKPQTVTICKYPAFRIDTKNHHYYTISSLDVELSMLAVGPVVMPQLIK